MKLFGILTIIAALGISPSYANAQSEAQNLKKAIAKCPAATRLLKKVKALFAQEGTTLKLKLTPSREWSKVSDAFCRIESGEIVIKSDTLFNNELSALVFELANLSQSELFDEVDHMKLSREEYTHRIEELEYRTAAIHDEIVSMCKLTSDWDRAITEYNFKDAFGMHWEKSAKNSAHADAIRKDYDALKQADKIRKKRSAVDKALRDSENYFKRLRKNFDNLGKMQF